MGLGSLAYKIRLRSKILGISEFANLNRGKVHSLGRDEHPYWDYGDFSVYAGNRHTVHGKIYSAQRSIIVKVPDKFTVAEPVENVGFDVGLVMVNRGRLMCRTYNLKPHQQADKRFNCVVSHYITPLA
jgi:hypothetical protein